MSKNINEILSFVVIVHIILLPGMAGCETKANDYSGLSRKELFTRYPVTEERTYRLEGNEEWITFDHKGKSGRIITFHLEDGKVKAWRRDDRREVITEYLSEFCSQGFVKKYRNVYTAIANVLEKIPYDVFISITERARPVIFTEYHYTGPGRLANSSDIYFLEGDPPAFTEGIWIVKLSTELDLSEDPSAIEAVVAHELAHRVLESSRCGGDGREKEKETNKLIKDWGFETEFTKAREEFRTDEITNNQTAANRLK